MSGEGAGGAVRAFGAPFGEAGASTPTQPSPIEGEGSYLFRQASRIAASRRPG